MKKCERVVHGQAITYFTTRGASNRPRIIFVPGIRGDRFGFEPYATLLKEYPLCFIELPGQGGATRPFDNQRKHTARTYADMVAGLIVSEGWDNVVLLGHSFGAAVALITASLAPTRVQRLILLAPVTSTSKIIARLSLLYYELCTTLPYPLNWWLACSNLFVTLGN